MKSWIVAALIASTAIACEKSAPREGGSGRHAETTQSENAAPEEGKFSAQIKISPSQEVYTMEGAPKPADVEQHLADAIHATPAFAPDGPRKIEGVVAYDIKMLPGDAGYDIVLLGGLNSPSAKFEAGVNVQSTDEKWRGKPLADMVYGAADEFASRIGAQARVIGTDDAGLLAILQAGDESDSAHLLAIQEVRERRLEGHLDAVRPYLAAERSPGLRLAACATLVSLGDQKSRSEILAVAEDFSRDRNPQFVPMLHILGDLGGEEVTTYLQAVADGHAAPAVRAVAQEVLNKPRER